MNSHSLYRQIVCFVGGFAVILFLNGSLPQFGSPAYAETPASSSSSVKSFDEMMQGVQKQMDQLSKNQFFSDPSLGNIRGFDLFDKGLEERFQKMFKGFNLNEPFKSAPGFAQAGDLKSDIHEVNGNLIITLDLPGHDKKSIDLKIKDNALIISSERKSQRNENDDKNKVFSSEISYGKFSRVIELPKKVFADKMAAKFENGVLTVTAPIDTSTPAETDGKKIEIQ
ncbi:MAG: Hsp20/alpha crystallin family protein [Candidatus Riflebacteria bacterium]|nr:Hsp20/alpha crystallin family protein [Candidatus Riflebacteria bacterium]